MIGIRGTSQVFKVRWEMGDQRQTEKLRAEAHWDRRYVCFRPAGCKRGWNLETKGICWKIESKGCVSLLL